ERQHRLQEAAGGRCPVRELRGAGVVDSQDLAGHRLEDRIGKVAHEVGLWDRCQTFEVMLDDGIHHGFPASDPRLAEELCRQVPEHQLARTIEKEGDVACEMNEYAEVSTRGSLQIGQIPAEIDRGKSGIPDDGTAQLEVIDSVK